LTTGRITKKKGHVMSEMKRFEIKYYLLKGTNSEQIAIIHASGPTAALQIFKQQNPGTKIAGPAREVR